MSRLNKHARKVDEIAKKAFEEYRKAENALKAAEEQTRKYPERHGMVNAEYAAQSARAKADYLEAKEAFNAAKKTFAAHYDEIKAVRAELAADIDSIYGADPAKMDANTIELLKSGILTVKEYEKLLNEAKTADNYTMIRLIGKYADAEATQRGEKYGQNDETARNLRLVSHESRQYTGDEHLQAFDSMADIYGRCLNNPGMIDHWGELTAETVESF